LAEVDSLLSDKPNDPYFLELKGQVLLESAGRVTHCRRCARQPPARRNSRLSERFSVMP
jgi:hypothetical protein